MSLKGIKKIVGLIWKDNIQKIILFGYFFLLTVLISIRDVAGLVGLSSYVLLIPLPLILLMRKDTWLYCLILTIFLSGGIPSTYYFLVFFLYLLVINKFRFSASQLLFGTLIVFAELIGSLLVIKTAGFDIMTILKFGLISFSAIYYLFDDKKDFDLKKILISICVSIILYNLIIFGNTMRLMLYADKHRYEMWPTVGIKIWISRIRFGDPSYVYESLTNTYHIRGLSISSMTLKGNPNFIGLMSIIGQSCSLIYCLVFLKDSKNKALVISLSVLNSIILFVFGFLSQSRTYFILLVVVYLSVPTHLWTNDKIKTETYITTFFLSVALVGVVAIIYPEAAANLIKRLLSTDALDNNRTTVFNEYWRFLFSNPKHLFFGIGTNNNALVSGASDSVHNSIQQLIVDFGVVGFVVVYVPFYYCLINSLLNSNNKKFITAIPIIAFAIWSLFNQLISPPTLLYIFYLTYIIGELSYNSIKKKVTFNGLVLLSDSFFKKHSLLQLPKHVLSAMKARRRIIINNIMCPRTKRHIVVFDSDDWGGIRVSSADAKNKLINLGHKMDSNVFTSFDCTESIEDLKQLQNVLSHFKDNKNQNPIFTLNIMMFNPDFDLISKSNKNEYYRMPFYKGREDVVDFIKNNRTVFSPQLHGSEHLNRKRWIEDLNGGKLDDVFQCKMISSSSDFKENNKMAYMDEFNISDPIEFDKELLNLERANSLFKSVFGYYSETFVPACLVFKKEKIKAIDKSHISFIKLGPYYYEPKSNYSLKRKKTFSLLFFKKQIIVRNCNFEPASLKEKALVNCLKDIDEAFDNSRPAIICTHRVNYVGGIDTKNRENGLYYLSSLIEKIITKYPDVEFCSADSLSLKPAVKEKEESTFEISI